MTNLEFEKEETMGKEWLGEQLGKGTKRLGSGEGGPGGTASFIRPWTRLAPQRDPRRLT